MRGGGGGGLCASRSEMGPTAEDTLLPLLELLVDPLLPAVTRNKVPSPAQEESVAKQVQAVVLLYDYYHRKHNPELVYLDFASFCKLAVVLKPSLLLYMKGTQKADCTEVKDLNKQLSMTEKLVKEACDVSENLYMSKGGVAGWPIAKVAVFLVDFRKENCFLLHSSSTQGVWSVIEKEHTPNFHSEGGVEEKGGSRKKRITKKPLKENRNSDEHGLQQLAFAAVKSAYGCSQSDLKILESHTVYSLSKVKTAARFYIMQCKQSNQEETNLPIRDVLDSLQGPLVRKESRSWSTTPAVEYFHLLPYTEILSDWFSRESSSQVLHATGIKHESDGNIPIDSTHEYKERDQHQKVVSGFDEASVPCLVSEELDLHAQKPNAGTEASKPKKIGSGQEMCISNSLTPIGTQVHINRESETGYHSKEELHNTSCSGLKSQNSKRAERAVEPVEAVVYKKRNKSLKRDKMGDDAGCKLSNAASECSQKDNESSLSSLSNDMEIDEPVPVACSTGEKSRVASGQEHVSHEMKAVVLSQDSLPCSTTVDVIKEEIADRPPNNHEQNGKNIDAQVKAGSSYQEVLHNALVPFHSGSKEVVDTTPGEHVQNGNSMKAEVEVSSSCQELMYNALIPFHSDSKDIVDTTPSNTEQNGKYINAEAMAGSPCQEVLHNALVPFHSDSKDIAVATPNGHEKNRNNLNSVVKAGSSCQEVLHDALVPFHSHSKEVDKIRHALCSREKLISQAALQVLRKKRDMLSHQLRSLEDEIALCDGNIQTVLSGSEDGLAVKLDAVIEGCNFERLNGGVRAHERVYQPSRDQDSPECLKRKRLSEANFSEEKSCQELDDICHENSWILPTYSISTSDGGFQSTVTVKDADFECSCTGGVCSTPREARESAASAALTKMRDMASIS